MARGAVAIEGFEEKYVARGIAGGKMPVKPL
jgi:hypothetical protein